MQLVVDANIVFAALIKDSHTRKLMTHPKIELFAPEFVFEELKKYQKELAEKTGLPEKEVSQASDALFEFINVAKTEEFQEFIKEAFSFIPNKKDSPYFALCLAKKLPLWSNDKKLKEQATIKVYTTHELEKLMGQKEV